MLGEATSPPTDPGALPGARIAVSPRVERLRHRGRGASPVSRRRSRRYEPRAPRSSLCAPPPTALEVRGACSSSVARAPRCSPTTGASTTAATTIGPSTRGLLGFAQARRDCRGAVRAGPRERERTTDAWAHWFAEHRVDAHARDRRCRSSRRSAATDTTIVIPDPIVAFTLPAGTGPASRSPRSRRSGPTSGLTVVSLISAAGPTPTSSPRCCCGPPGVAAPWLALDNSSAAVDLVRGAVVDDPIARVEQARASDRRARIDPFRPRRPTTLAERASRRAAGRLMTRADVGLGLHLRAREPRAVGRAVEERRPGVQVLLDECRPTSSTSGPPRRSRRRFVRQLPVSTHRRPAPSEPTALYAATSRQLRRTYAARGAAVDLSASRRPSLPPGDVDRAIRPSVHRVDQPAPTWWRAYDLHDGVTVPTPFEAGETRRRTFARGSDRGAEVRRHSSSTWQDCPVRTAGRAAGPRRMLPSSMARCLGSSPSRQSRDTVHESTKVLVVMSTPSTISSMSRQELAASAPVRSARPATRRLEVPPRFAWRRAGRPRPPDHIGHLRRGPSKMPAASGAPKPSADRVDRRQEGRSACAAGRASRPRSRSWSAGMGWDQPHRAECYAPCLRGHGDDGVGFVSSCPGGSAQQRGGERLRRQVEERLDLRGRAGAGMTRTCRTWTRAVCRSRSRRPAVPRRSRAGGVRGHLDAARATLSTAWQNG